MDGRPRCPLCSALDDNSPEHEWWVDPVSGELELRSEYFDDEDQDVLERGLVVVDPTGSVEAYSDMEDFVGETRSKHAGVAASFRCVVVRFVDAAGA